MVPGTPVDLDLLISELQSYASRVNAITRLRTIGDALQGLEQHNANAPDAHLFLLEMTPDSLKVTGFKSSQQREAQDQYIETEKRIARDENSDAVLVSVDSVASLRRAYPNYFLDTRIFADLLENALAGKLADPSYIVS